MAFHEVPGHLIKTLGYCICRPVSLIVCFASTAGGIAVIPCPLGNPGDPSISMVWGPHSWVVDKAGKTGVLPPWL